MLSSVDTIYRIERKIDQWNFAIPQLASDDEISDKPEEWTLELFPHLFDKPFSDRHIEFWQWLEGLKRDVKPLAFFAIWPRKGGKSTNAEAGAVYCGATDRRKFCLYVRSVQDKANESVQNIAALLENRTVEKYYPKLSERKLGKYGNSKGWRIDTLRCANGFNVVALGFDAAVRGIKIEEFRPDLIILDDIDDLKDSLDVTTKKIDILTKSILPAGSDDVAILGVQNLIKWNGIFHKIAEDKADFLLNKIVSGPYVAIENLQYERKEDNTYQITAGEPTWEGQDLQVCQDQMNDWGLEAFLSEAQHLVHKRTGRVYHAFTDKNIGPDSRELDYSQVSGYYHSHDFGAVNHVWGLWAKIGKQYFLVHSEQLPEGTTASRAEAIKKVWANKNIVAGWGGAPSEKQYRLDFQLHGVSIRTPPSLTRSNEEQSVESQIRQANKMFENETLMICSDMVNALDQLENCVRDEKEGIQDKPTWHYCDKIRYFAAGISRSGWVA